MRSAYSKDSTPSDKLPKLTAGSLSRLLALGRPYRGQLFVAAILMLLTTCVSLSLPILAREAVEGIQTQGPAILDRVGLIAALLLLVSGFLTFCQFMIVAKIGNRIIVETRLKLFEKLQFLTVTFFDSKRSGDLTSILSNDVSLLQASLTDDLVKLGGNLLQLVGGLVLAIVIDWRLTVAVFALMLVVMGYFVVFGIRLRKLTRKSLDALSEAMGGMTEALGNIRLVKAFVRESYENDRSRAGLEKVYGLNMKAAGSEGVMTAIASAGSALMLTGVVWYGGRAVLSHTLTVGALLGFLIDIAIISGPMAQVAGLYTRLQRAVGASDRIFDLMDQAPERPDADNAISFPKAAEAQGDEVVFGGVGFSYREEIPVLSKLDLTLQRGKVTAIVGTSGAGKTTLASLLYRFYEPQHGLISINGVPVTQIARKDLREQIGLVPQETILFSGSIKENIRYGRLDASDDDIIQAAEAANLWEFIARLPDGLNTLIGERGVTLSGGQRQRVAIARVILKDPRILILDEATSALDTVSETLVKDALDRLMEGRTTMVIAHRLSTVQSADQIAVMDAGQVRELGTHEALLAQSGLYLDLTRGFVKPEEDVVPERVTPRG